jgi:hypothetical protein
MARYRLDSEHFISSPGILVPAGTIVGDGTPYPWTGPPSRGMTGEDDEGRRLVDEHLSATVNPVTGLRVAPDRSKSGAERAIDDPGPGGLPEPGPFPPTTNNPVFRQPRETLQPIIPSPSEHVTPGPGGRPDPMRSPEEREADRDAAVDAAAAGGPGRPAGVPAGGLGGVDTRRVLPEQDRTQRVTDGQPAPQPAHPAATPLPGQPGVGGPKASALAPKTADGRPAPEAPPKK